MTSPDGSWGYISTDEASDYWQRHGEHVFRVAPSGTAGTDVSWTTAMTIDNSGNLGVKATPLGTGSAYTSLTLGGNTYITGGTTQQASNITYIAQNQHYDMDASWEYISTDYASRYYQYQGAHVFQVAGSGSAGNDVTNNSALTINNNRNSTFFRDVTIDSNLFVTGDSLIASGFVVADSINITNGAVIGGDLSLTGSVTGNWTADSLGTGNENFEYDEGSFSCIFETDCSAGLDTSTCYYQNINGYVKLDLPAFECTSDGTSAEIEGLPSAIQLSTGWTIQAITCEDNGTWTWCEAYIDNSSTISVRKEAAANNFTNSGNKGTRAMTLTYYTH